jgi:hypothetical protein
MTGASGTLDAAPIDRTHRQPTPAACGQNAVASVTAPHATSAAPVTLLMRPPQGSVFSTSTRSARAAI